MNILVIFLNSFLSLLFIKKPLLILQQSGYSCKEYNKWQKRDKHQYFKKTFFFSLICLITYILLIACFNNAVISLFGYLLLGALFIKNERLEKNKIPLKITKRVLRLLVSFYILNSLIFLSLFYIFKGVLTVIGINGNFALFVLCFTPNLNTYIMLLSNCINLPIENAIKEKYKIKAKKRLSGFRGIKIGITGSFAKTGVKEILNELLSSKYKVLKTEKSFNTPMGICKSVKELKSEEYFIAEMGAKHKGDITELCEMVNPEIGVITGIARQHLETFKTEENILNTKYELMETSSVKKGYFSSDTEGSVKLYNRFKGEKYLAGLNGDFVYAREIKCNNGITSFTLHIKDEKPVFCVTGLLGEHNVSNICLAVAVAYNEGVCVKDIVYRISKLKSASHRLEIKECGDKIIIDDSFNASEFGVKASIKVLNSFSGYKTVITPGLIELGKMQYELNFEFGKLLGEYTDRIAIIGRLNKEAIEKGIKSTNKKAVVEFYDSLSACMKIIKFKSGEVVLFENDLPDNYE